MRRTSSRALLVFLLACALHLNGLSNGFHYDDFHSIVDNPHLRSLENLPVFFIDPSTFSARPENAMYRPLLLASYAFNYALGEDPSLGVPLGQHGAPRGEFGAGIFAVAGSLPAPDHGPDSGGFICSESAKRRDRKLR